MSSPTVEIDWTRAAGQLRFGLGIDSTCVRASERRAASPPGTSSQPEQEVEGTAVGHSSDSGVGERVRAGRVLGADPLTSFNLRSSLRGAHRDCLLLDEEAEHTQADHLPTLWPGHGVLGLAVGPEPPREIVQCLWSSGTKGAHCPGCAFASETLTVPGVGVGG